MPFTYEYPHMAVTADAAVFTPDGPGWRILLIQRARPPHQGAWALPGGFVDMDERTADAAARELAEETGLAGVTLGLLGVYDRVDRDPRERTISLVYWGVAGQPGALAAGDDAAAAVWHDIGALPPLAFDHAEIIADACRALKARPGAPV